MLNWLLMALLIAALPTAGAAQTRGGFGFSTGGARIGPGFVGGHGHGFGTSVFLADPLWYADYPAQPAVYEPPVSSVVVIQPNLALTPAEPKPEPLMIEWQGDKYVRIIGQRETMGKSLDYSESDFQPHVAGAQVPSTQNQQTDMPPVVLVYRDGRREPVTDYVIANGNLYARGDYWRDGFWTKTVQLSILDLPTTLRINFQAGVSFVLPSGPNEVITRP
jgi:hypothetical protein